MKTNLNHFKAWLNILFKHLCLKKSLLFLIAGMAVLSVSARILNAQKHIITACIYCSSPDDFTQSVIDRLVNGTDDVYSFSTAASAKALKKDVSSKKAECGYIFPDNLADIFSDNTDSQIEVITSPSTVLSSIINEKVYEALFHEYAPVMLKNFIKDDNQLKLDDEELTKLILSQYSYNENESRLFQVQYEQVPDNFYDTQFLFNVPLRGILSVLIFICSLAGISQYRHDRESGFFLLRTKSERIYVPVLYSLIPSLISAACSFICLMAASEAASGAGIIAEFLLLAAYAAICSAFAVLSSLIIRSFVLFDAFIPVCVIAVLMYAPVFADISRYLPAGSIINNILPTAWYLKAALLL